MIATINEQFIRDTEVLFVILFNGYTTATNLSMVTNKVARTEPTRAICANPNLKNDIGIKSDTNH